MNSTGKSQKDNCLIFQEKIFELLEDGSTVDGDLSIKNHVEICSDCQNYLEKLSIMQNQMQFNPLKNLKPDSQIIKNIIAYKKIKSDIKRKNQESLWDSIRAIFEFRVPVYQALSGAIVVIILFLYASNNIISSGTNMKYKDSSANQTNITSSELYALDSLYLTNRTKGQNAKEDSVLISYLVPTM